MSLDPMTAALHDAGTERLVTILRKVRNLPGPRSGYVALVLLDEVCGRVDTERAPTPP